MPGHASNQNFRDISGLSWHSYGIGGRSAGLNPWSSDSTGQDFCSSSDRSGPPGTAIGSSATPQNVPWFGPAVPDRVVLHQASENTVRYSLRSRKAQLSPSSRLVGRVGPFGRSVTAVYRVAERAEQPGARHRPVLLGSRRVLQNGQVWLVWYLSCRSLVKRRILILRGADTVGMGDCSDTSPGTSA